MSSEQLQLLIAGYVLGDLDADEAAEFERLLAEDSTIAQEVAQMQAALDRSLAPAEVRPPDSLRSAILAAHELPQPSNQLSDSQSEPTPVDLPDSNRRQRRTGTIVPWRNSRAIGVAAAVLIVALGINNYRLWQALQSAQTEVRPDNALTYTLQSSEPTTTASAQVAVDPATLEGKLTTQNLPPLPPGKTYVLWTVLKKDAPYTTDSKGAILTQVFEVDAQGSVSQPITLPAVFRSRELIAKVAVTIEDASAPQRHEGTPILITQS